MAQNGPQAPVVDYAKGIEEDLVKIQQLGYKTSAGSYIPCMWDVGAGTMGPGGANGAYIRQCKKYALLDSDKQLCSTHARKFYVEDAREKTALSMFKKGQPLRRTAAKQGVFRPEDALVTADYYKSFNNASCPANLGTPAQRGVYSIEQAMCLVKP